MNLRVELVTAVAADKEWVDGALHLPESGFDEGKPSVILVHGAMGNFYTGIPRKLAPMLAQRGYPSLSINTRYHDYFEMDMIFAKEAKDIEAAVKLMKERGAKRIVLLGHSRGVSRVVYAAATRLKDDAAVVGLVLVAGNALSTSRFAENWGEGYVRRLSRDARRKAKTDPLAVMMLAGKGARARSRYEWYHPKMPPVTARLTLTARAFLDRLDPSSGSDALKYVTRLKVPILIVHGTKDGIVPPADAGKIKAAVRGAELFYVEGSGHYFDGFEPQLAGLITDWLARIP